MTKSLALDKVPGFGKLLQAYTSNQLESSYAYHPFSKEAVMEKIKSRQGFAHRSVLTQVLKNQNAGLELTPLSQQHITLLQEENTFCVTTGHQLALLGGPLFVAYKILSCVKICNEYKKQFPDYHFVPVFWMASEDHDKEEINHFKLFGKTFTWDTTQTGAVGEFSNDGIPELLQQVEQEVNGLHPTLLQVFKTAYSLPTLSEATRYMANALFGKYGLVIIDGNDSRLKQLFIPIIEQEINQKIAFTSVQTQNTVLEKAGYEARINPRELNLFYLSPQNRVRLEFEEESIKTVDGSLRMSKTEFLTHCHEFPERISPNVLLRPVYQESILPNLMYVGGPAETEYWLQLDSLMRNTGLNTPFRQLRICHTMVPKKMMDKLEQSSFPLELLFAGEDKITKWVLAQSGNNEQLFSIEKQQLDQLFSNLAVKAKAIDATLEPAVLAEKTRQEKALENMIGRILKAEKTKHEAEINKFVKIKNTVLPEGSPQERTWTLLETGTIDLNVFFDTVMQSEWNKMNIGILE